ncbi:DUF1127 domain-containing protein [Pseudomonas taeanensis]|jgi:uncharacterized protein YjiS (DUF1127 family)|uniref:DUF1127 domain-containing protein n=1 Tax=Pseudomonas taeanensis TaxID=574962 RepID=UPI0009F8C7E7|nr:DUF1127 domain-containing protein [Pseudomonas taeanensis]
MESILRSTLRTVSPPATHWRARLARWLLNARTRRQLAALDERQLADAGISRSERLAEQEKPFWR